MILATCAPGGEFSLISLPSLDQSRHGIYQMKAEYLTFYVIGAHTVENVTNKEYMERTVSQILYLGLSSYFMSI